MEFEITSSDVVQVDDNELENLLTDVYVNEGFTTKEEAIALFSAQAVKSRGEMFVAYEQTSRVLAGLVILVPPTSSFIKLAKGNEAEIHLLAVKPIYRGEGLGRQLVNIVIESAQNKSFTKIILWTNTAMTAAQSLYESIGFSHIDTLHKNN